MIIRKTVTVMVAMRMIPRINTYLVMRARFVFFFFFPGRFLEIGAGGAVLYMMLILVAAMQEQPQLIRWRNE
jgi:hypothetical protein